MAYKIAIGTSDKKSVNLHFGEIESVSVYEVNESDGSYSFLEERKISRDPEKEECESGCSCGSNFVVKVGEVVSDCTYFIVAKIGPKPHRLLQENKVNCLEAPFEIEEAVSKLNDYYISHKKRKSHIF
ncbi:MAG: hypothetical protein IJ530_08095 [Treponema sp.]|uniref:NifB/NifX family molybdenum-iron cluster-binding protein n=1 Tax=Treponema sp. TaxID=166 RepID=UPI0025F7C109|nr:NifB/NifX family molybdenum-iron cluster-binding protein [Treponema sp.]MBQ8679711.1 hypothetical protein [Treponema sp.]